MEKISNEIKVGILVFAALILLSILVFGVGEIRIFERGHRYNVIFDSSAGLNPGAHVRMGGVKVGSVDDVDFIDHKGKRRVVVTLLVRKDLVVHEEDRFKITMIGLLGDNYVEIEPGPSKARVIEPGSTIEGAEVIGMDEMFKQVQDGLGAINEMLDEPTVASFKETVHNTEEMSEDLAFILDTSREDVTITLSNLRSMSYRLDYMIARNEDNFDVTMDNLSVMSDDLKYTATSLRGVAEGLEAGEGTAGKLLKDDKLYTDLVDTTAEAKGLIEDVKERPGRYIHLSIF
ncbi:MAG: MlaD family protein [Candidatus Zixiibacteriota bacterium]|jgi:phospholipid/cholesterol/gamma-HCH transport system substrate-binding protein